MAASSWTPRGGTTRPLASPCNTALGQPPAHTDPGGTFLSGGARGAQPNPAPGRSSRGLCPVCSWLRPPEPCQPPWLGTAQPPPGSPLPAGLPSVAPGTVAQAGQSRAPLPQPPRRCAHACRDGAAAGAHAHPRGPSHGAARIAPTPGRAHPACAHADPRGSAPGRGHAATRLAHGHARRRPAGRPPVLAPPPRRSPQQTGGGRAAPRLLPAQPRCGRARPGAAGTAAVPQPPGAHGAGGGHRAAGPAPPGGALPGARSTERRRGSPAARGGRGRSPPHPRSVLLAPGTAGGAEAPARVPPAAGTRGMEVRAAGTRGGLGARHLPGRGRASSAGEAPGTAGELRAGGPWGAPGGHGGRAGSCRRLRGQGGAAGGGGSQAAGSPCLRRSRGAGRLLPLPALLRAATCASCTELSGSQSCGCCSSRRHPDPGRWQWGCTQEPCPAEFPGASPCQAVREALSRRDRAR